MGEDGYRIEASCELVGASRSTRDPHTPRDLFCPGVALAAWGSLV